MIQASFTPLGAAGAQPNDSRADRWFPCCGGPSAPRTRLFCFPFAGSGGSIFRSWSQQLPKDVQIRAVQLPGRGRRRDEPPLTSLDKVIDELKHSIEPLCDRPFVFFGYCVGALICFELARVLQHRGTAPAALIVGGRQAPQLPPPTELHRLSDERLADVLQSLNAPLAQQRADSARMRQFLSVLRADAQINETYCDRGTKVTPPIIACHSLRDPAASRQDMLAWRVQTTGRFRLITMPGDHYWLLNGTLRQRLMQEMTQFL